MPQKKLKTGNFLNSWKSMGRKKTQKTQKQKKAIHKRNQKKEEKKEQKKEQKKLEKRFNMVISVSDIYDRTIEISILYADTSEIKLVMKQAKNKNSNMHQLMIKIHKKPVKTFNTHCPICLNKIPTNSWITPCEHVYCVKCYMEYIEEPTYGKNCPLCREPLDLEEKYYTTIKDVKVIMKGSKAHTLMGRDEENMHYMGWNIVSKVNDVLTRCEDINRRQDQLAKRMKCKSPSLPLDEMEKILYITTGFDLDDFLSPKDENLTSMGCSHPTRCPCGDCYQAVGVKVWIFMNLMPNYH